MNCNARTPQFAWKGMKLQTPIQTRATSRFDLGTNEINATQVTTHVSGEGDVCPCRRRLEFFCGKVPKITIFVRNSQTFSNAGDFRLKFSIALFFPISSIATPAVLAWRFERRRKNGEIQIETI
jgi:hypothetical protein